MPLLQFMARFPTGSLTECELRNKKMSVMEFIPGSVNRSMTDTVVGGGGTYPKMPETNPVHGFTLQMQSGLFTKPRPSTFFLPFLSSIYLRSTEQPSPSTTTTPFFLSNTLESLPTHSNPTYHVIHLISQVQ